MGETTAGLVGGIPEIKGIQQVPGLPPYPEVMLESLVDDASALGAPLPARRRRHHRRGRAGRPSKAGQLLNRFGAYRRDYFVTRGNHDRAPRRRRLRDLPRRPVAGQRLLPRPVLPGDEPTYFSRDLQGLRVIGLDTYDKPGDGSDAGALSTDAARLVPRRARQATATSRRSCSATTRSSSQDSPFPITPSNTLDAAQAATILEDYAAHAGALPAPRRPHPPQQAHDQPGRAARHAPGDRRGQGVPRRLLAAAPPHRRLRAELLQDPQRRWPGAWSERSRQEIVGLWPQFALGSSVGDRNTVVKHDLSNLR